MIHSLFPSSSRIFALFALKIEASIATQPIE